MRIGRRLTAPRGCGRVGLVLLVLSAPLFLAQCYLSRQATRLLSLQSRAERIDAVLERGELEGEVSSMLSLVREIRRFSTDELGLRKTRSYTTYVETDRDYLVDVVAACEKDRFVQYLWRYPFVGRLPYKGFFEREDAVKEASKLSEKGYDVMIRKVDAFSTLGFFRDPAYTFMKDYPVYVLASVIIHEQTHATVFLRNQPAFNEELATFVGNEGALEFVRRRYPNDRELLREAVVYRQDWDRFIADMKSLYDELDALYRSGADRALVLAEKANIVSRFKARFGREYERNYATDSFRGVEGVDLNNAYLMTVATYTADLSLFRELHASLGRDLARTVRFLEGARKHRKDPKGWIRSRLEGDGAVPRPETASSFN